MNAKGFTLLELLIVILIIAILATLAVPQYIKFIERSRASEAVGVLGSIKSAQELYRLENGIYADTLALLDISTPSGDVYWTYSISSSGTDSYTATAVRTGKDAPPGVAGQNIDMLIDWTSSVYPILWCGSHVGVPRG